MPPVPRQVTGLFSLDYALGDPLHGDYGMPLRSVYEIYGKPGRGKNTLAFFLSGSIRADGVIVYNWLETADPAYVVSAVGQSGFHGTVRLVEHYAPEADPRRDPPKTHETLLKEGAVMLNQPNANAYILDSIGTTRSRQEREGDYGESFWGRRAFLVNQHMRELEGIVIDKAGDPCAAFALNHVQQDMQSAGGFVTYHTPGGVGKEYTASVRIFLKSVGTAKAEGDKGLLPMDGITLSRGVVEKLRFGGQGREFVIAIVPGRGLSRGLTALQDCYSLRLVRREAGGLIVHVDGRGKKSARVVIGKLSELIAQASAGDESAFGPLFDLLEPLYGRPEEPG